MGSVTTPRWRATSSASFAAVVASSRNVDGCHSVSVSVSVGYFRPSRWACHSLDAIQMKRTDSFCRFASRPASTSCQRMTESARAQPMQEPVCS
jgi:hypothetical protein